MEIISKIERIDDNTVLTINNFNEVSLSMTQFNGINISGLCVWKIKFSDMKYSDLIHNGVVLSKCTTKSINETEEGVLYDSLRLNNLGISVEGQKYNIEVKYKYESEIVSEISYIVTDDDNFNHILCVQYSPETEEIWSVKYTDIDCTTCSCFIYKYNKAGDVIEISKEDNRR